MTVSDPKPRPDIRDLHADAKALYLAICAYHVEQQDDSPLLGEIRNGAEQVALKLGEAIRSRVNQAALKGDEG